MSGFSDIQSSRLLKSLKSKVAFNLFNVRKHLRCMMPASFKMTR